MSGKVGVASLVALGLISTTGTSYAEDLNLDEVVVSAGLNPVDEEKVGRANTVITGKQLEQSQVKYVADALRMVPGVAVSRTGSYGGITSIRIRGAEANHVLVLVDGVEAAETSNGSYDFSGLLVSDIDRIEILRGPQSALYGSDAVSGVISIFTKGGSRNSQKATFQTEVGTDGTALVDLGVRGGKEKFDYAFSGAFRRSDGFNASLSGDEDDGDINGTLNGKVRVDITDNVQFDGTMRYINRKSDYDEVGADALAYDADSYTKTKEFYTGAGITWSAMDGKFVQKFRGEYTSIDRDSVSDDAGYEYNDEGDTAHLSYQGTYFFDTPTFADAKHSITGAAEWKRETFKEKISSSYGVTTTGDDPMERNLYGFVAEYRGEYWDNLFLSGAVRYDKNDDFKDAATYTSSVAYLFANTGTRLHSSLGTGVKNPTFLEQYGASNSYQGNEDLKPEESFSWDAGVEQSLFNDRLKLDVTYFNALLDNKIATTSSYNSTTGTYVTTPVNIDGTTRQQGIEVSADVALTDTVKVKASYTYLDEDNIDSEGNLITRRPKHSGSVNLSKSFLEGKAHAFVDVALNGDMSDMVYAYNPTTYASYYHATTLAKHALVNVGADYQINDKVQVYGRIENLLDADYQEVYGYNTAGITGYVGLKADF